MIEQLEPRRLLSGNVQVKLQDGILFLRGDGEGNQITIQPAGRYVRVVVDVVSGTSINTRLGSRKFLNFSGTVNADLRGGDNRLRIHNLHTGGGLIIRSANGRDAIAIDGSTFGGDVSIATEGGDDTINFIDTTVQGICSLRGGKGDDVIGLTGSTVDKEATIKAGDGADSINTGGSKFNANVRISGGLGKDLVSDDLTTVVSDFTRGSEGWTTGFADYPAGNIGVDAEGRPVDAAHTYNLKSGLRPLPAEIGSGTGMMLSGRNGSDDLYMFLKRPLSVADGVIPGQRYQAIMSVTFASDAPSGSVGFGGPPGEGVAMSAGAGTGEPLPVITEGYYRMNVPRSFGYPDQSDTSASVVGNIANGVKPQTSGRPDPYASLTRKHVHTATVTADSNGRMWLLVGTDSGTAGTTRLYYQNVTVTLIPVLASSGAA